MLRAWWFENNFQFRHNGRWSVDKHWNAAQPSLLRSWTGMLFCYDSHFAALRLLYTYHKLSFLVTRDYSLGTQKKKWAWGEKEGVRICFHAKKEGVKMFETLCAYYVTDFLSIYDLLDELPPSLYIIILQLLPVFAISLSASTCNEVNLNCTLR